MHHVKLYPANDNFRVDADNLSAANLAMYMAITLLVGRATKRLRATTRAYGASVSLLLSFLPLCCRLSSDTKANSHVNASGADIQLSDGLTRVGHYNVN